MYMQPSIWPKLPPMVFLPLVYSSSEFKGTKHELLKDIETKNKKNKKNNISMEY